MDLAYIIEKIKNADFSEHPFRHIEINELFEKEDFEEIVRSPEVSVKADNDEHLFRELFSKGYRIIPFPGCTENFREYIKWHKDKKISKKANTSCEGYGVVLRLVSPVTHALKILVKFINSQEFADCIAEKFNIDADVCTYDAGLQKYLDGYEISPHSDIRKKALTYMVNINPSDKSFDDEHHTSYLTFKPQWLFVKEFWEGNDKMDRCWVPWSWCEIQKQQRKNNSLVMFSPNNDTLHAVKANYNHLLNQRTQLYGNLWFHDCRTEKTPRWEDFVIEPTISHSAKSKRMLLKYFPSNIKAALKSIRNNVRSSTHGKRNV